MSMQLRYLDCSITVAAMFGLLAMFLLILGVSSFNGYLETYPAVQEQDGTTPLYFGLIMSFPGGEFDSSGAIAGVRVALDRINSDPRVLPNHTLHYTLTNSSVSRSTLHYISAIAKYRVIICIDSRNQYFSP